MIIKRSYQICFQQVRRFWTSAAESPNCDPSRGFICQGNFEGEVGIVKDNRPLIVADLEASFKDKEFDFVYCSHVLEHVRDPKLACRR
jgi:ubiquinone/menaquinone biosynthesis C-methylase UbiE